MKKTHLVTLCVTLLVLAISGCGLSGSGTTDNGTGVKLSGDYKPFESKALGFKFDYPADFTGDVIEDIAKEQVLFLRSNDCPTVTREDATVITTCEGLLASISTRENKINETAQNISPKDTGDFLITTVPANDVLNVQSRLEIDNKKGRVYTFEVKTGGSPASAISKGSGEKLLARVADSFKEITAEEATWATPPAESGQEISFNSCGEASKYKAEPFYADFIQKAGDLYRRRDTAGRLRDTSKVTEKDLKDVCYSSQGGLVMALMSAGEYCDFGGILKYDIPSKSLKFAEDTAVRREQGCASLSSIGKRHGKQIDVRAAFGDAGVSADILLNYDYNNNYLTTKRVCLTETTDFIKGTSKTSCQDYPLKK